MKVLFTALAVFIMFVFVDPGTSHSQRRNLRDIMEDSTDIESVGNSDQTISNRSFSGRRRLSDITSNFETTEGSGSVIGSGGSGGKRRLRDIVEDARVD